ncbi:MAG TPA: hypothetical protein VIS72_15065 [Anaerolineales bacterium]
MHNGLATIVAYLDGFDLSPVPFPNGKGSLLAKVNTLRDPLSTGGEELSALMQSVLDRAFKGEL